MTAQDNFTLRVKQLHPAAQLPRRGSAFAAGADLHCVEAFTLQPGARKAVPTGLALAIPPGYYGRVAPRSGWAAKHGIDTLAGIIDADYRGEVLVLLINLGDQPFTAAAGERIAQLIIERAAPCAYEWANELDETTRGAGGFGSTGC
ncbi:MAG: dUTP diphosphatase [Acidobacteria bacterium]|nr:dUTP diphosphatase [Acidobacteriota bacterium]MBI3423238.1 dUTP diphosphatase [Acidobacteriota bacterium]